MYTREQPKSSSVAQVLTYAQVSALRQSGAFIWHQDYSWSHVVGACHESASPHSIRPSAIPALQNAAISNQAKPVEDGTIMPLAGGPQLLKHFPFCSRNFPEQKAATKRQPDRGKRWAYQAEADACAQLVFHNVDGSARLFGLPIGCMPKRMLFVQCMSHDDAHWYIISGSKNRSLNFSPAPLALVCESLHGVPF